MKVIVALAAVLLSANILAAVPKPPTICLDGACPEQEPEPTGTGKKWNPGHYMLVHLRDSHQMVMTKHIPEVCRENAVKGMQYRILWADLEAGKSQYTFSTLDEVYRGLAACRKHLVVELWPAVFNTTDSSGLVPNYLLTESLYDGGITRTVDGYIAKLWEKPVMDRFIALLSAMAIRYDKEPYFEAIVFSETATSKAGDTYNPSDWLTQLKRVLEVVPPMWPKTSFVMYANFIQGSNTTQRADLLETIRRRGAGLGTPDVLPPPHTPENEQIYRGEIGAGDMRGSLPAMFAVQTPELGGKEGTFTPKQLYDHCVGTNRCSHMFWIRNTSFGGDAQKWDTGILPFLRTMPLTVRTCPKNYIECRSASQ